MIQGHTFVSCSDKLNPSICVMTYFAWLQKISSKAKRVHKAWQLPLYRTQSSLYCLRDMIELKDTVCMVRVKKSRWQLSNHYARRYTISIFLKPNDCSLQAFLSNPNTYIICSSRPCARSCVLGSIPCANLIFRSELEHACTRH
jgi:hypothetical protein